MNTIDRLKALEKAATAGPWITGGCSGRMVKPVAFYGGDGFLADVDTKENSEMIVSARNALPALLKVAEAARAYHDMATSRYDSSRVAEFERKQDALGEALAELEAN